MNNSKKQILLNNLDINKPIFNFLTPEANDQISTLNKLDQNQLVLLLNNFYLTYRQKLGFSKENTFGVEIEFKKRKIYPLTNCNKIFMEIREITGQNTWDVGFDGSLLTRGLEVSSPILKDTNITWQRLENVCTYLKKIGYIDELCGGHVHIGSQVIGKDFKAWENFIKLWIVYEDIILRFFCGEYSRLRTGINTWASPISRIMYDSYQECLRKYSSNIDECFLEYFYYLLGNPQQAINFRYIKDLEKIKDKNTIEFRSPNGTLNPIVWQNNINLLLHILTSVKTPNFNKELLNIRFEALDPNKIRIPDHYKYINLELALEFCDLIFDNNLSKLYFLKQYLKNSRIGGSHYHKSPSFTKKLTKH